MHEEARTDKNWLYLIIQCGTVHYTPLRNMVKVRKEMRTTYHTLPGWERYSLEDKGQDYRIATVCIYIST